MKKTSHSSHGTLNELNITPLLDLAFVLLVIFIITTPQLVNHLEMSLPSAESTPQNQPSPKTPSIQRISINAAGQVFLNQTSMSTDALRSALTALKSSEPELAVVVQGSDEAEYQAMVRVLDVLRQLEISRVGLATLPESSSLPPPGTKP